MTIRTFKLTDADMGARREIAWEAARTDGKVLCRSGCDRGWFTLHGMGGTQSKRCVVCGGTGWMPPVSSEGTP